MIRESIAREIDQEPDFEWRGTNVTRIENLSDIVFALSLGMLVSASSVPTTFNELSAHLLNIVPVAAGFGIMLLIWNTHFTYFRRYGLADAYTIFLNAVLLLFVLFIAYPLRFTFDALFAFLIWALGGPVDRLVQMDISYERAGMILAYYALAYCATFLIFGLMYAHALRRGDDIGLSDRERSLTRVTVANQMASVAIGLLVFVCAKFTQMNGFAGFLFFLTHITVWINGRIFGPKSDKKAKT